MKIIPFLDASTARETTKASSRIEVCMHVLGTAATDPRVLREATALVEAGYTVSIVDIEEKENHQSEQRCLFALRCACFKLQQTFITAMRYQDYSRVILQRSCAANLSFLMHMKCLCLSDLYQNWGEADDGCASC